MRTWLRDHVDPVFQRVVRRLDPSIGLDDHLAFVLDIEKRWRPIDERDAAQSGLYECLRAARDALRESTSVTARSLESTKQAVRRWRSLDLELDPTVPNDPRAADSLFEASPTTLARPGIWSSDRRSAARACFFVLRGLSLDSWDRDFSAIVAADALSAHPPKEWFVHKRGTFYGTASLLHVLIGINARMFENGPELRNDRRAQSIRMGTLDILERLIRHIEVRREDSLRFAAPLRPEDEDPFVERMRFAMALIDATELFGDLRCLNGAMKLVDNALSESQQDPQKQSAQSMRRHLSYVIALAAQEALMRKVSSS